MTSPRKKIYCYETYGGGQDPDRVVAPVKKKKKKKKEES
jgi:hypothetical protein